MTSNSLLNVLDAIRCGNQGELLRELHEIDTFLEMYQAPTCCEKGHCFLHGAQEAVRTASCTTTPFRPSIIRHLQPRNSQPRSQSQLYPPPQSQCAINCVCDADEGRCRLLSTIQKLVFACPNLASAPRKSDGMIPLHIAAIIGNTNLSIIIASVWPDAVGFQNKKGKTPLHFAAREGYFEMVSLFLNINPGAACITTNDKLKLPLHFAAMSGYPNICRLLLAVFPQGATMKSQKGKIPLHLASRAGNMETVDVLLSVYPEGLQLLDWEKSPPLHIALREDRPDVASCFIQQYPEALRLKNATGEIPMDIALRKSPVHLVENMIRTWPQGGRIALRNVRQDENVEGWEWNKIELCLKGASGVFEGDAGRKENMESDNRSASSDVSSIDENEQMDFEYTHDHGSEPLSENTGIPLNDTSQVSPGVTHGRNYFPVHSILEITSCPSLVARVLNMFPDQITVEDSSKRLPLHVALSHPRSDVRFLEIVRQIIQNYPQALYHRDSSGKLPLHVALCNKADLSVVDLLIKQYPQSAVENCGTMDSKFVKKFPLFMATEHDCSVDVIFRILSEDPNVLNFALD